MQHFLYLFEVMNDTFVKVEMEEFAVIVRRVW